MARQSKKLAIKPEPKGQTAVPTPAKGRKGKALKKNGCIIVEGIAERKYFQRLKDDNHKDYDIVGGKNATDSYSTEHLDDVSREFDEKIRMGVKCFYVADLDRIYIDHKDKEGEKDKTLKENHPNEEEVVFCESMPSFEFWLLMYFPEYKVKQYNRMGADEKDLERYIHNYSKTSISSYDYLFDIANISAAAQKAETISYSDDSFSHTNVHKAIKGIGII